MYSWHRISKGNRARHRSFRQASAWGSLSAARFWKTVGRSRALIAGWLAPEPMGAQDRQGSDSGGWVSGRVESSAVPCSVSAVFLPEFPWVNVLPASLFSKGPPQLLNHVSVSRESLGIEADHSPTTDQGADLKQGKALPTGGRRRSLFPVPSHCHDCRCLLALAEWA